MSANSVKAWQILIMLILQLCGAIWWASGRNQQFVALTETVQRLANQVDRIDNEGGRKWANYVPSYEKKIDKLELKVDTLTAAVTTSNLKLERMSVLTEQNNRMSKQ